MAFGIYINGVRLDPRDAAKQQRPLDTALICPACNGGRVQAKAAQTSQQLYATGVRSDLEDRQVVPRLQDRYCLDCGHRWVCVLPPEIFA